MKKKLHDQLSMLGSNSRRWTVLKFIKNVNLSFGHLQLTLIVVLLNSFFASTQCTTPPAPSASGVTVDCGTPAIFTASGTPAGGSYVWYSNAAGTNQVGTGSTFTTPALNANTTYYVASSVSGGTPSCNTNTLANILSGLNTNQSTISSTVTNGYNFTMDAGVNSNYISDGGNDMYDAGNYISTNFTTNIPYSDGVIASSGAFGTGSSYFTSKINNMWVLTANLNNVSTFTTNGNNGADGGGLVNGTSLSITVGCQQYTLFLKRIWNAGDPSINQMVIIPTTSGVNHTWSTNTNDGFHQITGLNSVTRMYYLLYASAGGSYLDDNTAINIATTFLTQVSATISVPNVCLSSLTPVTANVNQVSNPSVTGATVTCGQTATLTASGAPSGGSYVWYSDGAGANQVGTGSSFTTPNLNSSTTYYVASTSGPGTSGSQVFNFTGNVQSWVVPNGVTQITIEASGAQGFSGGAGQAGLGGTIQSTHNVTPGETLSINVGGRGTSNSAGGWNGGGATSAAYSQQGRGGGASDVRQGGTALSNRIIVAGGGGGAGYNWGSAPNDNAGHGGSLTGGRNNSCAVPGAPGYGGTQSAGGAGGAYSGYANGSNGALGIGGAGATSTGGGGGGGGYYGGGGGSWSGGGGGSSFSAGTILLNNQGVRSGDGQITISWNALGCLSSLVPVSVTVNPLPGPVVSGTTQFCVSGSTTLTATGTGNTIEWYADAAGTQLISTGTTLNTPVLTANTTYYVREIGSSSGSQTFNYTGGVQTFTAPAAGTYTLDVYGARGGNVTSYYPTNGGLGGRSQGTITLTAGQVVYVYVGEQGADLLGNHPYGNCTLTPGGWNGGGANRSQGNGTPGGGASDIRIGGQGLANRVIVAGGGGGCGWYYAAGGAGGGLTGGAGTNHGSGGATQAAGGAVGSSGASCVKSAGTLGQGGDGSGYSAGGGGGGGGYYGGGGGGYDQGGGGGSSYIGGVTNGTTTAGVRNGNGQIVVSWTGTGCTSTLVPVTVTINAAPTVTATASSISPCVGQSVTLTAGGATSYSWSNGVNTSAQTLIPNATATYTVTGTTGSCSGTAQVTVTLPTTGSSLSGNSEDATCTVNQNGWVHFYHSSGRLIGSINSQGQNLGNVTMTSYVDGASALVPACTNPNPIYATNVLQRHWVITPQIQPNDTVLIRLPHTSAEYTLLSSVASTNQNQNDNIVVPQDLDLTKYSNTAVSGLVDGNALNNCGSGTSSFHEQINYGNTNSYSGVNENYAEFLITGFSEFWLHGSAVDSPLPVELVNFQANCSGEGKVNVTWATASEHNSANFTVEKSRDGINWSVLASVAGAGNSTQMINYSTVDNNAASGVNYYRLTQTDFDGAYETFNIASANCGDADVLNSIKVYPNPSAGDFYIDFTTEEMLGESVITITDSRGSEIYSQSVTVEKGNNVFHIEQLDAAPGLYYIKVSNGTTTSNIVKHSLR